MASRAHSARVNELFFSGKKQNHYSFLLNSFFLLQFHNDVDDDVRNANADTYAKTPPGRGEAGAHPGAEAGPPPGAHPGAEAGPGIASRS